MSRIAAPLAAVALAAILTGGAASAPRPLLTQASSGKTIQLGKRGSATLRLSERWRWTDPHASTRAVELTPVVYYVDPGFREWTIKARKAGRATIRSLGKPNCSTCPLTTRNFRLTIVVG